MDEKLIHIYQLKRAKKFLESHNILERAQLESIETKIDAIKKEEAIPVGR